MKSLNMLTNKKRPKKSLFLICTGCRNRTYVAGFGDRCTATVRIPPKPAFADYFVCLCKVCFLHFGQCFFACNFSFNFFLFLVVK